MRHFSILKRRSNTVDRMRGSRADIERQRALIHDLHAITARTRKRVSETRELLERVDLVLQQFDRAWQRSL
jgi:uncharacterized membrane protein